MTDHIYKPFDADIDAIRSALTTMGGLVEQQFIRAIEAVRTGDLRRVTQVLTDEKVVNQLHLESDLRCNQLIAKRQPIAVDLREIIAVIHSIHDLERMGDEAKKIALKASVFEGGLKMPIPFDAVALMADRVADMVRLAIDAFLRQDEGAAEQLYARDREVDRLRDDLVLALIARMSQDASVVTQALAMVFVVQSIERIGDHAKNLAEYVVHIVSGVDPRHAAGA